MKDLLSPRFKISPVELYTQAEVQAMLKVCHYSKDVQPGNRKNLVMRLPYGHRDQAVILFFLDTGSRAMEFCSLVIGRVEQKTAKLKSSMGHLEAQRAANGRAVLPSLSIRCALCRYLVDWEDGDEPTAYLFVLKDDRPI